MDSELRMEAISALFYRPPASEDSEDPVLGVDTIVLHRQHPRNIRASSVTDIVSLETYMRAARISYVVSKFDETVILHSKFLSLIMFYCITLKRHCDGHTL